MEIDSGATAWVLTSAALVLLMTPGLAFFYGGMTRAKSVLNMMMMSFVSIAVVSMLWVAFGYSIAFTDGGGLNQFTGSFDAAGLEGLADQARDGLAVPELAFAGFQMMFAIITVALISGAIADRARFGAWIVFTAAWATLVYFPVAHWVWGGGWLADVGVLDFAGGTAVHVNAGAAALALALVLGRRKGWPQERMRPHNMPFVLLGTGLLWFGWFGFNAGSAVAADGIASLAFVNTQVATAAAAFAWIVVEKLRYGHSTTLGLGSGAVAGLVAITPACAFISPLGAIGLGLAAGAVCAYAVSLKYKLRYDDSLDVVGVHLVGGALGSVLIGLLGTAAIGPKDAEGKPLGADGLFYGGGLGVLGKQALGVLAVGAFSFAVTFVLGKIIDATMGFRADADDESEGLDVTQHAETAYELGPAGGARKTAPAVASAEAPPSAAEPAAKPADGSSDKGKVPA